MSKKLSVGDKVECRFYNTYHKRFYGKVWLGKIIETNAISPNPINTYLIEKLDEPTLFVLCVQRKEILRRVKEA